MFNEGMPGISGKWLNKRTGEYITVRDSVIDGDDMIIICDKGRLPMDIFSRDYIQVSDEIYDDNGKTIGKAEANAKDIIVRDTMPQQKDMPTGLEDIIDPDSIPTKQLRKKIDKPVQKENANQTANNIDTTKEEVLINKVFEKVQTLPNIVLSIEWAEFPTQQIATLVDFLDIDKSAIAKHMIDTYMSKDQIALAVNEFLSSKGL